MDNDDKEFNRKSIRLQNWNYSDCGYYFITICANNRKMFFGNIANEKMVLNDLGKIVARQWLWLAEQYPYLELDEFIVMPNHLHGILINNGAVIANNCRGGSQTALITKGASRCAPTIGKIKPLGQLIGAFKTTSSKLIHQCGMRYFAWQRNYYEHIIRNEKSLNNIRNYIHNNPNKWECDRNNPKNL